MLEQHIALGAGVTVAAIRVPIEEASQFGVIETDGESRTIGAFREKPKDPVGLADSPGEVLASMGNYVFSADVLMDAVTARRRRPVIGARHRRQHHPRPRLARTGVRVGLRQQQRARCERARPPLLARRRNARRLLRRAHGPDLCRPELQPLQLRVADPHLARAAAAGEVRLRGGGRIGAR